MVIIVGTTNQGKIREIGSILSPLGYELRPQSLEVEEIGATIEENAIIKAISYSLKNRGNFVLVEDSGLVVPKLNGLPGAYSSRFHTVTIDSELNVTNVPHEEFTTDKTEIDRLNNERLSDLIKTIPFNERTAYFEVCFAIAKDGKVLHTVANRSYGHISEEMKGNNGFGYDPLFIGNDSFGKTYAELDSTRKNLRSHRKKALQDLSLWMVENIKD